MRTLSISLFVLCVSACIQCARILIVSPTFDFNHRNLYNPLWKELANRGHTLTLLTSGSIEPHQNITQIDFFSRYEKRFKKARNESGEESLYPFIAPSELSLMAMPELVDAQFNDSAFEDLVTQKFDLMLMDMTLSYWALVSAIFKCPLIVFSCKDASAIVHSYVGNAIHPAIFPWQAHLAALFELEHNERLKSTWYTIVNYVLTHYITYGGEQRLGRKYFGSTFLPSNFHYLSKTSLLFTNTNPIFYPPRPVTPITINLGGFLHIADPQKLPEDLQKYLDDSKHGCIYVSFGTTVNSKYLTEEQKEIFVQVFQEMTPMRILWKFDQLDVAKNAKNIEIRTWVPQQDVLRHPNVKLFITQGGLQSMEEAIDSAVPMLGMPFYGDQYNNVLKMRQKRFGKDLNVRNMDKKSLKAALDDLLKDPIYKKNIDKFSAISKDTPMKGLEKAVWWTEYVLRHGGTEHLRSPSADIPLYQYYFLDVIALSALIFYLVGGFLKCFFQSIPQWIRTTKHIIYLLINRPKKVVKKD